MTYESLMIANQTITKIEVKGKEYAEVNQRIRVFRMLYPNGSIETNIESLENAELSKICCIYGKGYEMYYVDELGNIGITYLTPFDAFMIYDDSVLCRERYFVRLYIDSNDVLHGSVSDAEKVRWFTQKGKRERYQMYRHDVNKTFSERYGLEYGYETYE